jgi:Mrp family chromosome partitioning ATPase
MSLIESAMAKARALAGAESKSGLSPRAPRDPRGSVHPRITATRGRSAPIVTEPTKPVERIVAQPVFVDPTVCKQNRVLLDLVSDHNPGAVAAYRMLRTRFLQRARARQWTTIGITSAGANDGKSLTALNLALSLARERNSDVVLLDLDMRGPSICRYLGTEPPHEVIDFFEQRTNASELFFSIGVPNLVIVSGTVGTDHASELLSTDQFERLVDYSKTHTQSPIILIDLPPVLNTDDALVVAPRVDAMLLVVSEGYTNRVSVEKALEVLSEFPIAGLVLNRALETQSDVYGYEVLKR